LEGLHEPIPDQQNDITTAYNKKEKRRMAENTNYSTQQQISFTPHIKTENTNTISEPGKQN
jgi:hypothetical protein